MKAISKTIMSIEKDLNVIQEVGGLAADFEAISWLQDVMNSNIRALERMRTHLCAYDSKYKRIGRLLRSYHSVIQQFA